MHRLNLALQRRSSGSQLEIPRALAMKKTDDVVAAKVRRVGHRRTPVAVGANQYVFTNECRILGDERADGVEVVAPDRVREPHGVHEPRPARRLVAARQRQLRVCQPGGSGIDGFRMVLAEFSDRFRVAGMNGVEEFLGLAMELIEIGTDR